MVRGGRRGREEEPHTNLSAEQCRMLAALISYRLRLSAERNYGSRRAECLIVWRKACCSSSPSPESSLQAETKPLHPIGPNIRPPCNTAEGHCGGWSPRGRELLLREKKRIWKKTESMIPLQKKWSRLCFITIKDSDSPEQPFPKQSSSSC